MLKEVLTKEDMKEIGIVVRKNATLYLPLIWKTIVEEYKEGYELNFNKCITCVYNEYGIYSNKIDYIFNPDENEGKSCNQYINRKVNRIFYLTFGSKRLDIGAYKAVVSGTLKILSHIIPIGDEADKVRSELLQFNPQMYVEDSPMNELGSTAKWYNTATIYGIYYKEELIYIGQTTRPLSERVSEHLEGFKEHSKAQKLYQRFNIEDWEQLKFKVLFTTITGISNFDLNRIENMAITLAQPKGNVDGFEERIGYADRVVGRLERLQGDIEEMLEWMSVNREQV